jgi:medium-chain acyl-[acyl-carrier-protein] hydrolase
MGALIAFELARYFRQVPGCSPTVLCVACCRAPQLTSLYPAISHLPPYLMWEELRRRYGTSNGLAGNEELLHVMLPVMRADLLLCETYRYVEDDRLSCPVAAYGGNADATVDTASLDAWSMQTSNAFMRHVIVGDHFFPIGSKAALLEALSQDLAWSAS